MISEQKIKWINSLQLKKYRDEHGLFVAEGVKLVTELMKGLKCRYMAYTHEDLINGKLLGKAVENSLITEREYKKITSQKTPQGIIAVFEKPKYDLKISSIKNQLSLALDNIQDPGNLGTIIRTADWFGIKNVYCSLHTADIYNPKTIQATMGALLRVQVHYIDLKAFFQNITLAQSSPNEKEKLGNFPIYGTLLEGKNIYDEKLSSNGMIVMGNEGKGISSEILPFITQKLTIPNYPKNTQTSESLNVSIATAIALSEFRRRKF